MLLVKRFVQQHRAGRSRRNVQRLTGTAKVLAARRASLAQALRSAPMLLRNFLQAYDPGSNLLRGRANLNELTIWANSQLTSSTTSTNDSATSHATSRAGASVTPASTHSSMPPALLPSVGRPTDVAVSDACGANHGRAWLCRPNGVRP